MDEARGVTYFGRGDGAVDRASGGDNAPFKREDISSIFILCSSALVTLVLALYLLSLKVNVQIL
jgi:hypothetical protein